MHVRFVHPSDEEALRQLHERHGRNGAAFADPNDGIHRIYIVAEDGAGRILGAGVGRSTLEVALSLDREAGSPADRWDVVKTLLQNGALVAAGMGFRELHLFPDHPRYARRLLTLHGVNEDTRIHQFLDLTLYGGGA